MWPLSAYVGQCWEGSGSTVAACSPVDAKVDGSLPDGDAASVLRCGTLLYIAAIGNSMLK